MESNSSLPVAFDYNTAKALLSFVRRNKPVGDISGNDYTPHLDYPFACKVDKDGGEAGSCSGNCSFTYTVKDLANSILGSGLTPKQKRISNLQYATPPSGAMGIAYYDGANNLNLYCVADEIPNLYVKEDNRTFVTSVICNGDGTITVNTDTLDLYYLSCQE